MDGKGTSRREGEDPATLLLYIGAIIIYHADIVLLSYPVTFMGQFLFVSCCFESVVVVVL